MFALLHIPPLIEITAVCTGEAPASLMIAAPLHLEKFIEVEV
jgi:hypothetical protein